MRVTRSKPPDIVTGLNDSGAAVSSQCEPIRNRERSVPRSRAESFPCNYMYRMANRGSPYRQLGHFGFPFNGLSRLIRISSAHGLLLPSFIIFFMNGVAVNSRVRSRVITFRGVSFTTAKESVMTRLHN